MSWRNDEGDETVRLPAISLPEPELLPLVHYYTVMVTRNGETRTQYQGRNQRKAEIIIQYYVMTPGVEHVVLYRNGRLSQTLTIDWSPKS